MARYARILSKSSIYHIMLRGINRAEIFFDDDDRNRFIDTLEMMKDKGEYAVYAYCLMDNHIHLLIKEISEPLRKIMKRIEVSYAYYFNKKYRRVGHLFQDRYRSETIEDDSYLLAVVRYIHNNPVKARIVKNARDYAWSSYKEYLGKEIVATKGPIISTFSDNEDKAIKLFEEHMMSDSSEDFIEMEEDEVEDKSYLKDPNNAVIEILKRNGADMPSLHEMKNRTERNRILRELKAISSISIRELSIMLGISKDIIFRA